MKKIIIAAIALALAVSAAQAQIVFKRAVRQPAPPAASAPAAPSARAAMKRAEDIHGTQYQLAEMQRALRLNKTTRDYMELQEKRFRAMDSCNITRLAKDFKDPDAVWEKMKEAYDKGEKGLAVSLSTVKQEVAKQPKQNKYQLPGMSDQDVDEVLAYWSLGNSILTDVYANQDAWGKRKTPGAPSLPLWDDQKYLYEKEWDAYYTQLNAALGAPPEARPAVGEERYDYAKYGQVQTAHNAYVAALAAKNPAKAAALSEKMKQPPQPPRPLPPATENVLYLGDVAKTQQVFPSWPAPWQTFIDSGFKDYNPSGEMAADFAGPGFQLKGSAALADSTERNNRLTVYQALKKEKNLAEKLVTITREREEEDLAQLAEKLEDYVYMTPDINLKDTGSYAALAAELKKQKLKALQEAERLLAAEEAEFAAEEAALRKKILADRAEELEALKAEDPEYHARVVSVINGVSTDSTKRLLTALKKDTDGAVRLTLNNASEVDALLEEAKATEILLQEEEKWNKTIQEEARRSIDAECLNGGV